MKRKSIREHPLCVICLFVRTYGLSRRPHELHVVSLAGAFVFALSVAGMIFGLYCVIMAGQAYSRRNMGMPETKHNQTPVPIKTAHPQGAPSFF